jgi:CHASE3 domain
MDDAAESKVPYFSPQEGSEGTAERDLKSTERRVRFGFTFALGCLAIIALVSYWSLARLNATAALVEHTHEVLDALNALLAAATDSETAERGYVITGDASYLEPYRQSAQIIPCGYYGPGPCGLGHERRSCS